MNTARTILRTLTLLAIAAGALLAADPASAQPPPDYGHDFVTVGAPGNPGATAADLPHAPEQAGVGRVDYEFRITSTEVTTSQWWEFARLYQHFIDPNDGTGRHALEGRQLFTLLDGSLFYDPRSANRPVETSWYMAARYVNWLHNGQGTDQESFETGVYDTSTFTRNPDGTVNDQQVRSAGSLYFLPSENEIRKAAYYDPNRHGEGLGGYWQYGHRSDLAPISGLPSQGGQTNTGVRDYVNLRGDVGEYADVQSPWGLFDVSGGESEWLEDTRDPTFGTRAWHGTSNGDPDFFITDYDRLDAFNHEFAYFRGAGFRVASAVPSPTIPSILVLAGIAHFVRRFRS
jgi:formylglycine-generating enzyme required for sulfatase activity